MPLSSRVPSTVSVGDVITIQDARLSLDMHALSQSFPRHELLITHITSFLRNKKLKYINITFDDKRIAYYSKEHFLEHMHYIKQYYDQFTTKSYAVRNGLYDYTMPNDILHKNHTFTKPELIFWDELAHVIYAIPLVFPSPAEQLLAKLHIINTRHKEVAQSVLRFAPVSFAALAIILGQIKQNDDPEHLVDGASRTETDFGTYYTYTLHHKDIPDGLKIIQLSDIHLDIECPDNMDRLATFAKDMDSADFIFLTGDIFHQGNVESMKPRAADILRQILKKADKGFFVLGNHDYKKPEETRSIVEMLDSIGYTNATNRYYELMVNGQHIGIAGLDDYKLGTPHADSIHLDTADNVFNIMLTHNLDGYAPLQEQHQFVDLVLSGHVHSGEIELGLVNGTKTIEGYKNTNDQLVGWKKLPGTETLSYIDPGFSTINPLHVRFLANPAGITEIDFKKIKR